MARSKKKTDIKNQVIETEVTEVVLDEVKPKKSYVVVLSTPTFFVVRLEDGSMKTVEGHNNYKKGDIAQL